MTVDEPLLFHFRDHSVLDVEARREECLIEERIQLTQSKYNGNPTVQQRLSYVPTVTHFKCNV